jgi:hypothetical protein
LHRDTLLAHDYSPMRARGPLSVCSGVGPSPGASQRIRRLVRRRRAGYAADDSCSRLTVIRGMLGGSRASRASGCLLSRIKRWRVQV